MTAQTIERGSAYPQTVTELLPRVREIAERLGQTPARNHIMREFKVGAAKANELRRKLIDEKIAAAMPAEPESTVTDPWAYAVPAGTGELPATLPATPAGDTLPLVQPVTRSQSTTPARKVASWPVMLIALPAFVAIWSGWVGLGGLTGFGVVHPLPGIADGFAINTAITLPIGVEVYAAYALRAWLSGRVPLRARRFAKWSAIGSLLIGALGQVAYHVLVAAGVTAAPWWITTLVACLPVAVLGMGAALAHLLRESDER